MLIDRVHRRSDARARSNIRFYTVHAIRIILCERTSTVGFHHSAKGPQRMQDGELVYVQPVTRSRMDFSIEVCYKVKETFVKAATYFQSRF